MSSTTSFSYSIIDAFASSPFQGNPAAVVIVDGDLKNTFTDDLMQKIAVEFNLSETAFITPTDTPGTFGLRWFTPTFEINLCGHATLSSGFVLSSRPEYAGIETFKFNTMSGELTTRKLQDGSLEMNFPAEYSDYEQRVRKSLEGSTKAKIVDILAKGNFLVVVFDVPEGEHMGDWIVKEGTLVSTVVCSY
jgi:PhzF family phenazine biosynthesis protein